MAAASESTSRVVFAGGSGARPLGPGGRIGAVVEVSAGPTGRLPVDLISSVYRASRSALMVLVCQGSSRAAIDAALTPTVQEVGLDVHGVLYLDADDDHAVREAVRQAPLVVASSEGFRARLDAWGVPFVDPNDAVRHLERWGERAAPA
ncbi:MAG TPA: hypothetical protein VF158_03870 [Longimicrobiales bacterium]